MPFSEYKLLITILYSYNEFSFRSNSLDILVLNLGVSCPRVGYFMVITSEGFFFPFSSYSFQFSFSLESNINKPSILIMFVKYFEYYLYHFSSPLEMVASLSLLLLLYSSQVSSPLVERECIRFLFCHNQRM